MGVFIVSVGTAVSVSTAQPVPSFGGIPGQGIGLLTHTVDDCEIPSAAQLSLSTGPVGVINLDMYHHTDVSHMSEYLLCV